jgi:hypothetical protein
MVSRLQMISQSQLQAIQLGLPIVQPQNLYETMIELTKASDFSTPARFWTDPQTVEPQEPPPDPNIVRAEMDNQTKQAELQIESQQAQSELQMRDKELMVKAEVDKYKIDKDADTKIQLARMQANTSHELEDHKAQLDYGKKEKMKVENLDKLDTVVEATQEIAQNSAQQVENISTVLLQVSAAFQQLAATMAAPKQVIRDKSGKVIGVAPVG